MDGLKHVAVVAIRVETLRKNGSAAFPYLACALGEEPSRRFFQKLPRLMKNTRPYGRQTCIVLRTPLVFALQATLCRSIEELVLRVLFCIKRAHLARTPDMPEGCANGLKPLGRTVTRPEGGNASLPGGVAGISP